MRDEYEHVRFSFNERRVRTARVTLGPRQTRTGNLNNTRRTVARRRETGASDPGAVQAVHPNISPPMSSPSSTSPRRRPEHRAGATPLSTTIATGLPHGARCMIRPSIGAAARLGLVDSQPQPVIANARPLHLTARARSQRQDRRGLRTASPIVAQRGSPDTEALDLQFVTYCGPASISRKLLHRASRA